MSDADDPEVKKRWKTSNAVLMKGLWAIFDRGDHLSDADLKLLIKSAQEGEAYLRARGEYLAAAKTTLDLHRLQDYLGSRKNSGNCNLSGLAI